jgi:glutathione synthase/RimK-type ligase-like ATP-grasp enzyme
MAIFSQDDPQTKVDFRKYNTRKPNRVCPYKLPNELGSKINSFMNRSGLETGSLDFVYTSDNKYIFLEVNPVGQFGMVSGPCNYYLEKKIANHLINN